MASALLSPDNTPAPRLLTLAEYLTFERASETKHHFYKGRVVPFGPVSFAHNCLPARLSSALHTATQNTNCHVLGSDMRILVTPDTVFYADALLVCNSPQLLPSRDVLLNPVLIAEVCGPLDDDFERNQKFASYQCLAGLQFLLFFSEARPFVEQYRRNAEGAWTLQSRYDNLKQSVVLTVGEITLSLPLTQIYADKPTEEF